MSDVPPRRPAREESGVPASPGSDRADRPDEKPPGPTGANRSRRWLLAATGVGVASTLAGCRLRQTGGDGDTGDGATGDGNAGAATSTTVPGDATYTIEVRNFITAEDLEPVASLSTDTTAVVTVEADANYDDRADELLFEQTVELAPEASRTFEDAFETAADGPEYVVSGELEPLLEPDDATQGMTHTGAERFTPGGFGSPRSDTFIVGVRDGAEGDAFEPWLSLQNGRVRRPSR